MCLENVAFRPVAFPVAPFGCAEVASISTRVSIAHVGVIVPNMGEEKRVCLLGVEAAERALPFWYFWRPHSPSISRIVIAWITPPGAR